MNKQATANQTIVNMIYRYLIGKKIDYRIFFYATFTLFSSISLITLMLVTFEATMPTSNYGYLKDHWRVRSDQLSDYIFDYPEYIIDLKRYQRIYSEIRHKKYDKTDTTRIYSLDIFTHFSFNYQIMEDGTKDFYAIDGLGRRIPELNHKNKNNIFLGGCSHAYGHGLNSKNSLGVLLQDKIPNTTIYNIALPGKGLHDFIFQLMVTPKNEINRSTFIYYHYGDSINRTLGKTSPCCPPRGPHLNVNETLHFDFNGFYQNLNTSNFFNIINYSAMYSLYYSNGIKLKEPSQAERIKYCKMLGATAKLIEHKFKSVLYLIFAPMSQSDRQTEFKSKLFTYENFKRNCLPYVKNIKNLKVVNLEYNYPQSYFFESHPRAKLQHIVATKIANEVTRSNKK